MPTLSHRVAAVLAATLLAHGPLAAREPPASTPLERWTTQARASLERRLADPRPLGRSAGSGSVVDIAFALGEDGRATRVSVLHRSGSRALDGKAAAAVRRLRTRTSTPSELAGGRVVVARIFFVPRDIRLDDADMRAIVARTAARNGWAERDRVAGVASTTMLLAARR